MPHTCTSRQGTLTLQGLDNSTRPSQKIEGIGIVLTPVVLSEGAVARRICGRPGSLAVPHARTTTEHGSDRKTSSTILKSATYTGALNP